MSSQIVDSASGKEATMKRKQQMRLIKILSIAFCVVVACAFLVPTAAADDWNKRTTVTFSQPVEVPGVGEHFLPAGTYLFKLMDSSSDRNIVQIFNEDGTHIYTTILAISNYRLRPTDKTVMTFRERAEGQPEAIKAWFYPGDNWGQEFVYPKARAIQLAKVTQEPVLATPVDLAAAPVETLKTAPVEAVAPTGETVELAQVVQPPPVAAKSMPQTASWLSIFILIGLLSMGTGFALWLFSKRDADQRVLVSDRAR
jgi:flagellar basal body-associated protein FliL